MKSYNNEYMRKYYQKNKKRIQELRKIRRQKKKNKWNKVYLTKKDLTIYF